MGTVAFAIWIVVSCYFWSTLTEPQYTRLMFTVEDDPQDIGIINAFIYYTVLAPGYLIMLCCELWVTIVSLIKKGFRL
ncbi:hypothetical protein EniLVp02_0024 [Vibrio phage EniLVp02]